MLLCSPVRLFIDVSFWAIRIGHGLHVEDFLNISTSEQTDCALITTPCESKIANTLYSFDDDEIYWFDLIVVYILTTAVLLIGIVTNIINVVIFSKYRIASGSTNNLLLGLAVSDLMSLFVNALINIGGFLCFTDAHAALSAFNILMTTYDVYRYLNLLSLDFVTAMSIQRAALVLFPFKMNTIFSRRNTNMIILGLAVLCFLEMFPTRIFMIPGSYYHPYFNKTIFLGYTFFMDYQDFIDYTMYYTSFRGVLGLLLISVSVSLTIFKLNSQAKNRATLKSGETNPEATISEVSSREAKVVKMSLSICFVTFVIYSIAFVTNQIVQIHAAAFYESALPSMAMFVQLLILSMNGSYNFFLYMAMSDKYRVIFKNLLNPAAIKESEYYTQFQSRMN